MTLQEAKSIVRHLGLTLRKVRSGDYCVKSRDGNEATPYYTVDLEDAVFAQAQSRAESVWYTVVGASNGVLASDEVAGG